MTRDSKQAIPVVARAFSLHIRARKCRRRRAAAAVFSSRLCALTIYASAILSSFRSALLARESLDRTIFFSSFLFAESSRVPLLDLFTFQELCCYYYERSKRQIDKYLLTYIQSPATDRQSKTFISCCVGDTIPMGRRQPKKIRPRSSNYLFSALTVGPEGICRTRWRTLGKGIRILFKKQNILFSSFE